MCRFVQCGVLVADRVLKKTADCRRIKTSSQLAAVSYAVKKVTEVTKF